MSAVVLRLRFVSGLAEVVEQHFDAGATVADLRKVATDHPTLRAYDSVNLIHNGDVLTDDSVALCTRFAAKDNVLVSPARKPPKVALNSEGKAVVLDARGQPRAAEGGRDDEDDDVSDADLIKPLPGCSAAQIKVWFILMPLAAKASLGPVYIIVSLMCLMITNLGTRKEGEASAYSIFNQGVRRLPGEMTQEQVDNAFRGRHM